MITIPRHTDATPHTLKMSTDDGLDLLMRDIDPLFIYAADNGKDWVRCLIPRGLFPGLENLKCPCCDTTVARTDDGSFLLDIAAADVTDYVMEERM